MEPTNTRQHDSEPKPVIDDHLEPIVQDFQEFRDRVSQSTSSAMKLEDIVDLYIDTTCANSDNQQPHTSEDQLTALLHEFIDFTPHSPQQAEPYGEDQTLNLNTVNGVTYIRYGDLNYDGAAADFISRVFGSEMNFWWRGMCGAGRGKRAKRKYRWVMESEEESGHSMQRAKLNERGTAPETHGQTVQIIQPTDRDS